LLKYARGTRNRGAARNSSYRDRTGQAPVSQDFGRITDALKELAPCSGICSTCGGQPRRTLGVNRMVPFFVQIKCELGQSYSVANALADAEIASEIYSTAGDFDLLVKFYVPEATDIGHFVNEKVQTLPGIQDTRTIITFKAFGSSAR
jgi:DNA-binding Lrp family transcriptional regulator